MVKKRGAAVLKSSVSTPSAPLVVDLCYSTWVASMVALVTVIVLAVFIIQTRRQVDHKIAELGVAVNACLEAR